MKKFAKKLFAAALSLTMLLSVGISASAVDTDPNMTAVSPFVSVFGTSNTLPIDVDLQAIPADANFIGTFFNTEAAAQAVIWDVVGDTGGIDVTLLNAASAEEFEPGLFLSQQTVEVNVGSTAGAASISAVNPASVPANAEVNFTVVLTDTNNADPSAVVVGETTPITVQVIDPEPDAGDAPIIGSFEVDAGESTDLRSYVTVLDSIARAATDGNAIVSDAVIEPGVNIDSRFLMSLTVDSTAFASPVNSANPALESGWQYRVYSPNGDGSFTVDPASEFLSAGDYGLVDGQFVLWQFGVFGTVNFPATVTPPVV